MSADTLVVAAIVIGAVAYLVRHFVRAAGRQEWPRLRQLRALRASAGSPGR